MIMTKIRDMPGAQPAASPWPMQQRPFPQGPVIGSLTAGQSLRSGNHRPRRLTVPGEHSQPGPPLLNVRRTRGNRWEGWNASPGDS